jgi:hypothetical protein
VWKSHSILGPKLTWKQPWLCFNWLNTKIRMHVRPLDWDPPRYNARRIFANWTMCIVGFLVIWLSLVVIHTKKFTLFGRGGHGVKKNGDYHEMTWTLGRQLLKDFQLIPESTYHVPEHLAPCKILELMS